MRLTSHTDYALRVLIYLAAQRDGRLATIKDLADAYGISRHHLRMVIFRLSKLGLVQTVQGKGGGCRLAQAPERIIVGDVVRKTEPDFHIVECFERKNVRSGGCRITRACSLKHMLAEAQRDFLAALDRYTVADMVKQRQSIVRLLRIAA